MRQGIILIILFGISLTTSAQNSEVKSVAAAVKLDSVVIVAKSKGFNVEDFIELVQKDQTFYKAFKNLRTESYRFGVEMQFRNRKDHQRANYQASNIQWYENGCRAMEIYSESYSGNFFKKKKLLKYKYYTAKLYHRLFCTDGIVCEQEPLLSDPGITDPESEKMESHVSQLKRLIFSPGQQANIPFIKNKTAIFSDRMRKFYEFQITSEKFNGQECYVFSASVKPEFKAKVSKTVIKHLSTWFSKTDFQVIARRYTLQHRVAAYSFDVDMGIDLIRLGDTYYPQKITYNGFWNVIFKKFEKGNFTVLFSDFGITKS